MVAKYRHADTMNMSSTSMASVFFTSTTTPLYSDSWSPSNTGQYAGTCIFLILLATVFRTLFALRAVQERKWQLVESRRQYIIAGVGDKEKEQESKLSVSSRTSDEGSIKVIKKNVPGVRPWRITQDVPRACVDVVIAGVGYLL